MKTMRKPLELAYSLFLPKSTKKVCENSFPILIFHCTLGCRKSWDSVAQKIADTTEKSVYTLDCANHGESPRSDKSTYFDTASDTYHFMEQQRISRCDLIGHSLGGRTAMVVALQKPATVRTLSVVDISPIQEPKEMASYMVSWIHTIRRAIQELPELNSFETAKKEMERKLYQEFKDLSFCQLIMDTLIYKDNRFHCLTNLDFLEKHFPSQLQHFPDMKPLTYTGPTCFIGSGKPAFLKLEDHLEIYKMFPKAEISYIPGTSHNVYLDKPVEFLKFITGFHKRFNYIP